MLAVKKFYGAVCKIEETLATLGLIAMTALVLLSALGRAIGYPINWGMDISLMLFAWVSFMGADVGIRLNRIINVDFLVKRFPPKAQKYIAVTWSVVIIAFLVVLVAYGVPLCISNAKRQFQNIAVSYSYITASIPVCAVLMIISMSIKLKNQIYGAPVAQNDGRDVV
ncbi:hypothetical protein AGMMS49957_12230 [Synergistales bacterium]|nr:hypothetical protein AGMMS49957_12230 [Synergistales bacterium]